MQPVQMSLANLSMKKTDIDTRREDRLLDIACLVCGDKSSGRHYGIYSCDGCSGFFKRSIHKQREYACKAQPGSGRGKCPVDKTHRNQCRACRLNKCLQVDMNKDAVQHERGPRRPKFRASGAAGVDKLSVTSSPVSRSATSPPCQLAIKPCPQPAAVLPGAGECPMDLRVQAAPRKGRTMSAAALDVMDVAARSALLHRRHQHQHDTTPFPVAPGQQLAPYDIYSRLFAGQVHPGVCGPLMPRPWLPTFPLVPGTVAASPTGVAMAATVSGEPSYRPRGPVLMETATSVARSTQLMASPMYTMSSVSALPPRCSESLTETASRLLFSLVSWVSHIPSFSALAVADQVVLLEASWRDMFLISLAQSNVTLDWSTTLLDAAAGHALWMTSSSEHVKIKAMSGYASQLTEIIQRLRHAKLDVTEYTCLKALVLFRPDTVGLADVKSVQLLQDEAQLLLSEYERHVRPDEPSRFGKLLLTVPCLRAAAPSAVATLFFANTIGSVPVERLVTDIYRQLKTTSAMADA